MEEDDFGFSAVDEIPTETKVEKEPADLSGVEAKLDAIMLRLDAIEQKPTDDIEPSEYWKAKMKDIEDLVVPMLEGLSQNSEKAYIHWPNRKPLLDEKIKQIKKLTRQ